MVATIQQKIYYCIKIVFNKSFLRRNQLNCQFAVDWQLTKTLSMNMVLQHSACKIDFKFGFALSNFGFQPWLDSGFQYVTLLS